MDWLTFDRVLAVVGFFIAVWQIRKTRSAAEAAKAAATRAVEAIRRLEAATKMHDISSRSRELLRLLRSKAYAHAASAAFELRDTAARYRHDKESKRLVPAEQWSRAILDIQAVHDRLESLAMAGKASAEDREALVHEVSRLHTFFTELAAQASAEGTSDAHPE